MAETAAAVERAEADGSSPTVVVPRGLTAAERRGLLMVVGVALFQEVPSNVVRGAIVGAASVALLYSQFSRPPKSS
ncbi:hypothetical protein NESM_000096900 [Novymonas esmeraldas]|uniref:Uncharacterized protein n=1 Tax=Novymonas esmeraldas TaxID=1808958 RepID=A0AAW0F4S2_9TRYP